MNFKKLCCLSPEFLTDEKFNVDSAGESINLLRRILESVHFVAM